MEPWDTVEGGQKIHHLELRLLLPLYVSKVGFLSQSLKETNSSTQKRGLFERLTARPLRIGIQNLPLCAVTWSQWPTCRIDEGEIWAYKDGERLWSFKQWLNEALYCAWRDSLSYVHSAPVSPTCSWDQWTFGALPLILSKLIAAEPTDLGAQKQCAANVMR